MNRMPCRTWSGPLTTPRDRLPQPGARRGVGLVVLALTGLGLTLLGAPTATAVTAPVGMTVMAPTSSTAVDMATFDEAISLEEAVRRVRERTGGRVLRAETRRDNARVVHRVRVLSPDGRVRTWTVDAETGRIS